MPNFPLGDVSLETFLKEYWQKTPLLVRNALPEVPSPISAEELAGLSCEEQVESRIIIREGRSDRWELTHGPFTEIQFQDLPGSHWTLLVQAVDYWVPAAADLLAMFNFIPNWRVDDLMISLSGDGGGVGPHFDHYDVFLVQVSGRRQWEVGKVCDERSPRRVDTPVMILSDWEPTQNWTLEPGDILYVPPGVSHSGVAVGDGCMTCSVGFRAPSHSDIIRSFASYLGDKLGEEWRYTDPDLTPQTNPGYMTPKALEKVRNILRQYVDDPDLVGEWFGQYMTEPKYSDEGPEAETYHFEDVITHLSQGGILKRNEGSRFAYQKREKGIWLFVDGRTYCCNEAQLDLVERLCAEVMIDDQTWVQREEHNSLLMDLINQGSLYLSE